MNERERVDQLITILETAWCGFDGIDAALQFLYGWRDELADWGPARVLALPTLKRRQLADTVAMSDQLRVHVVASGTLPPQ